MAFKKRQFQDADPSTPPIATAPKVDETPGGDIQVVKLADPAEGSEVPFGTASNPIRTDPAGITTQPVEGSVTAVISQMPTDEAVLYMLTTIYQEMLVFHELLLSKL